MKSKTSEFAEVEPNAGAGTLIFGERIGTDFMERINCDNLLNEQEVQKLLEQMDRTATGYARSRKRLNTVIRARKIRQQVAWGSASRERKLLG